MSRQSTFDLIDWRGRTWHFDEHVYEGDWVELWADPETETGFSGAGVAELVNGDWRIRELTEGERATRLACIRSDLGLVP